MIKLVSIFNLLFQIRAENQSTFLSNSWVKRPCRLHRQPINILGRVEGLKGAAT